MSYEKIKELLEWDDSQPCDELIDLVDSGNYDKVKNYLSTSKVDPNCFKGAH